MSGQDVRRVSIVGLCSSGFSSPCVGLVEQISEFIVRHECNIEDSKMAVFCGEFALIVLASGSPAGDRALWVNPRIVRTGGGTPPTTVPPATSTPVGPCEPSECL